MSKTKLLSIAVIGLLLINITMVSFLILRKPPPPPEGRPPMGLEGQPSSQDDGPKNVIIDRLGFDKEQVAAYEKLIAEHQASVKSLQDSIHLIKNALYQTLNHNAFTGKDSLINQLNIFQKQMELTHYDHFTALKKLCRPDQMDRFNKLTNELARFFTPGKNNPPPPPKE